MLLLTALLIIVLMTSSSQPMETGDYFWHNGSNLTTTLTHNFTKYYYRELNVTYCVALEETEDNITYFPKCCPPRMNYNTTTRGCFRSTRSLIYDDLGLAVNVIKAGLSDCTVVVDHLIERDAFLSLIEINKSSKSLSFYGVEFQYGSYCFDDVNDYNRIVRVCYNSSYCDNQIGMVCVHKCCRDGEVLTYEGNSSIVSCQLRPTIGFYNHHMSTHGFTTGDYAILHRQPDCYHRAEVESDFTVDTEGILLLNDDRVYINYFISPKNYCIETLEHIDAPQLFLCMDSSFHSKGVIVETIQYSFKLFSLLCLVAVMIIYYYVYRLKASIHKIVFSYCLASVIEELPFLVQLYKIIDAESFFYLLIFTTFTTCTWSNVMCYDIWQTLRSLKQNIGHRQEEDFRKMTYFSIYGWILPIILTLVYKYESRHRYLLTFFHMKRKQFNSLFYFVPLATFTIIDAVCFTLTVCYIIRAKWNLNRLQNSEDRSRNKKALVSYTTMTVKLFLLMGVTHSISSMYSIVHMKDFKMQYNTPVFFQLIENIEGIIFFVILVLKWNCIKSIPKWSNILSRCITSSSANVHVNNNET